MKELNDLKISILKKFMFIILMISVVEYAIMSLIRRTLFPFIEKTFFYDQDMRDVTSAGLIAAFVIIFVIIILDVINSLVPDQFGFITEGIVRYIKEAFDHIFMRNKTSVYISRLSLSGEVLFFGIMFAIVILLLIPCILGAVYYSTSVIRQIRIIEEKEAERKKEYDRRRNLMLSDIAHDLRTPITTVSGYARALSDGMVPEDRKQEYLDAIQTKSVRMNELITLLFDYVRLDSEGFKLNKTDCDICEIVRECAAFQYQDIEDAGMSFDIDIPEEKMIHSADKLQFSRVVTNLLTNAVKHNDKGTTIGLFVEKDESRIRIIVADSGKFIENAEDIFEPFVMGDESRNSRGGSGLGLSISKKIVEMHGFSIKLIQQPDIKKYNLDSKYVKMFFISVPINE